MSSRSRTAAAAAPSSAHDQSGFPDHPLFPVEEGERTPNVQFIQITRKELGVMKYGPIVRADDLLSLEWIAERYGGGMYELIARGPSVRDPSQPGNITKRRWYPIPGRSRPMAQDPTAEEIRQAEGSRPIDASPAPAAPPAAAPAAGESLLLALLNMQQQSARESAEASRQFMALMMTMITDSKKESVAQMQNVSNMMMQFSTGQQQSMMAMVTALLQSRGGGPEEMSKWTKILRELGVGIGAGAKDDETSTGDNLGRLAENVADTVQGLVELKKMGGVMPTINGAGAPSSPPLPGTAAAVAAEMAGK